MDEYITTNNNNPGNVSILEVLHPRITKGAQKRKKKGKGEKKKTSKMFFVFVCLVFFCEKSGNCAQHLAQNCADWYMNGSLSCMGLLSNFAAAHSYQNQT